MQLISSFDDYCTQYDQGSAIIGSDSRLQVQRTCNELDWDWGWDRSLTSTLLAAVLRKSRKRWFLRQCRNSEEGFSVAFQNGVEFFSKQTR